MSIKDSAISVRGKKGFALNIAPDGTGMSPSARSEYIRHRHKTKHGFTRAVMLVNTDTREILSLSVTSEETGETAHFERLVCEALQNAGVDVSARKADKKSDDKQQQQ